MALKYNGVSPTAIKYNGTDLTVLKYGTTAVWGKPYSLSISAGSNTSVTVSRTSSPNQHASTGTLSSGSVIYYGDVLTISYSVSSGYKISTSTVNGTTFSSGATFTVTSAISVVTTAVASASWKTIYSGSMNVAYDKKPSSTTLQGRKISVSGLLANVPTRITISQIACTANKATTVFINTTQTWETSCGAGYQMTQGTLGSFYGQSSSYIESAFPSGTVAISIDTPTEAGKLPVRDITFSQSVIMKMWISKCLVTKIEQYY